MSQFDFMFLGLLAGALLHRATSPVFAPLTETDAAEMEKKHDEWRERQRNELREDISAGMKDAVASVKNDAH